MNILIISWRNINASDVAKITMSALSLMDQSSRAQTFINKLLQQRLARIEQPQHRPWEYLQQPALLKHATSSWSLVWNIFVLSSVTILLLTMWLSGTCIKTHWPAFGHSQLASAIGTKCYWFVLSPKHARESWVKCLQFARQLPIVSYRHKSTPSQMCQLGPWRNGAVWVTDFRPKLETWQRSIKIV